MNKKSPKNLALASEFAAIGGEIKLDSARQVLAEEYRAELDEVGNKLDTKLGHTIAKAKSRRDAGLARAEKEIAKISRHQSDWLALSGRHLFMKPRFPRHSHVRVRKRALRDNCPPDWLCQMA